MSRQPSGAAHDVRAAPAGAYAVLPLVDQVVYPNSVSPVAVGRRAALAALKAAGDGGLLVAVRQRDPEQEEPTVQDLHEVGTIVRLARAARLGTGREEATVVAFLEGLVRARLDGELQREPFLRAIARPLTDTVPETEDPEYVALQASIKDLFEELAQLVEGVPSELPGMLRKVDDAAALSDLVAWSVPLLPGETQQELLATTNVRERMRMLVRWLTQGCEEQRARQKIRMEAARTISDAQRRIFLEQELKAIRRQLGEEAGAEREVEELRQRIEEAQLPDDVRREATRELDRLRHIPEASPERSMVRTYLEWLADLPWRRFTSQPVDLDHAARILDEDHHDLEKVKERILEHLAVYKLQPGLRGPILCFVGPPGVGKTSLGKSIARAMGRTFVRLSLGGMHDEAEIRGHRRTYIGAMPGQIIRSMRQAGSSDPVFMLDEVDKVGKDFRGDPAAALLEVLDPEQNASFRDNYLDVPFDLSRVLFITTANVLDPVPPALRDRMETLELPGYIDEEKLAIARRFLIPKNTRGHGLDPEAHVEITDDAILTLVRNYTHEAGVRSLERSIAAICRKRAREVAGGGTGRLVVTPRRVREMLGVPPYRLETEIAERTRIPGVAVAVAWTPYGGDVMFVEASRMARDKGEFTLTGQIGDVMQESARAAFSWVRAHAECVGIDEASFRQYDVHIHVPTGAVPKDGPSAGVVMVAALVSLFTGRPMRAYVAMTGEITLSGLLLPIGGVKEKVLAARRSGVRELILPTHNREQLLEEVPSHLRERMTFRFAGTIAEAIEIALQPARAAAAVDATTRAAVPTV